MFQVSDAFCSGATETNSKKFTGWKGTGATPIFLVKLAEISGVKYRKSLDCTG
jgi:hypothetical protein